jgi:CubicO group peptidase (beta-lactamase class C family)
LHLDEPISKYIQGFSHAGVGEIVDGSLCFKENARDITLRDILTHSSGLGSGEVCEFQRAFMEKPYKLSKNVQSWNGRFLDFSPGAKSVYSGTVAFELAALAVERVANKPYGEFLQEEIFTPLGMVDTCYALNQEQAKRLVEMPFPNNKGQIEKIDMELRGFEAFAQGYTGGSAGLFSTLKDYMRFAQMLAFGGSLNGVRVLSEDSVKEMGTNQRNSWGLSVYVRGEKDGNQPLEKGSFGWSGAYGTHFWVEPSRKIAAVLMLNIGAMPLTGLQVERITIPM